MQILVIDDLRVFKFDATYARNLYEADFHVRDSLHGKFWDEIWLDNDLGPDEEVYSLVVRLEELAFNGKLLNVGKIYLHSDNIVARNKMFQALNPFYNVEIVKAASLLR
jgi:hypothetical protein